MNTQNILATMHLSLLNVDDINVPNWNFRKVISPFTRIYLVKDGEGSVLHNNKKYELKPGKLYLIPSFTLCNYESDSYLDHYYIHLIPKLNGGVNVFDILAFKNELQANNNDFTLIQRILELNPCRKLHNIDPGKYSKSNLLPQDETLNTSQQAADYLETQGIMFQLFSRFIKTDNESRVYRNLNHNSNIGQAIEFIHKNLSNPISVNTLAQNCNLSDDYFSRLFLKIMGTRPVDYINRKRIEAAQLLLITTNDTIEKIALENGIENFPYFNRLFKKYSGTTPTGYRKLHRLV